MSFFNYSTTLYGYKVIVVPSHLMVKVPAKKMGVRRWHGRRAYARRVQKKWIARYGFTTEAQPNPAVSNGRVLISEANRTVYMTAEQLMAIKRAA